MTDFITHYGGYVLSALGITGQLMAGRRNAWGWILGLVSQCAWVTYIAATDQWSLIWGTAAYAVTYVINFRTERRKQRTERNQPAGPTVEELTDQLAAMTKQRDFWEQAADETGQLYSGAESQRDGLREQVAIMLANGIEPRDKHGYQH